MQKSHPKVVNPRDVAGEHTHTKKNSYNDDDDDRSERRNSRFVHHATVSNTYAQVARA